MPSTLRHFTDAFVRDAAPGEYQDEDRRTLYLYVNEKGARSFGFYGWISSKRKPMRRTLGRWPDINVKKARSLAVEKAKELEETKDESGALPAEREPSIEELVTLYTARRTKLGDRTPRWVEKAIRRSFADWHSRPLSALSRPMIENRYIDVKADRGTGAALVAIKALRALFAFAIKQEVYRGVNTAQLVDATSCEPRKRVLSEAEYGRVLAALDSPELSWWYRPFFRLLMLTGVRRTNMAMARWEEMDLEAGLWNIPGEKSKNGKPLSIALTPEAVTILRDIAEEGRHAEWVFPAVRESEKGHLTYPYEAWKKVLKLAGIPRDVRVHDIRRTFGSRLLNQGVQIEYVSAALGHANVSTTLRHYAHADITKVHAAVLAAAL